MEVLAVIEERLAELERAAANCIRRGHPDWVLSLAAGELAELCAAARYGHERGTWLRIRSTGAQDTVPVVDLNALGDEWEGDDE